MSEGRGAGGQGFWSGFLDGEVIPALFAQLDRAFPEFGFVRKGDAWQAKDDAGCKAALGCSAHKVFCKQDAPWLLGVRNGQGMPWVDYVNGGKATGEAFKNAVCDLAGRAGVAVPDKPTTAEERAALEQRLARAAELAAERAAEAEAEKALTDEEEIARARRIWDAALSFDESDAAKRALIGYFQDQRKIDLSGLSAWPRSIRYGAMHEDGPGRAVLAVATGPDGAFRGLQRIGVSPDGEPVRNAEREKVKMMAGRPAGGAVHLQGTDRLDTLILCEGVETGVAIWAATGMCVACVLSAGFYQHYDPPACFERVVVAGDLDRSQTGQSSMVAKVEQLRAAGRRAEGALPGPEHAPELVRRDGQPRAKSVDWLDVYASAGAGVVARAMRDAGDGASDGGKTARGWDGPEKLMPKNDLHRARFCILDNYAPPIGKRASRGIGILSLGGRFYEFVGTHWRDLGRGIDSVRRDARRWAAEGDWHELRGFRVKGETVLEAVPLCLSRNALESVVHAISDEAMVIINEGAATRFWINPMFDAAGRVNWGQKAYERVGTPEDRPLPSRVIALGNGLLDVDAWAAGKVRLMPHTELYFNTNIVPWMLPDLGQKIDDDAVAELINELCPEWLDFLVAKLRGDEDDGQQMAELQKWAGYLLTPDISRHYGNLGVWVGPPGTGKGTAQRVLGALIGEQNCVATRLDLLGNGPHMASWIGKHLAHMSDAGLANRADKELAVEVLKGITGGDSISLRKLYQDELPNQQLATRILMITNQMPDLPDRSRALDRRMVVWDWSVTHKDADTGLVDRLLAPKSMAGVLLWALVGLRQLEADGGFRQPDAGRTALDLFQQQASEVSDFVDGWLVITDDDEDFLTSHKIYEEFCVYWKEERQLTRDPIPPAAFMAQVHTLLQRNGWRGGKPRTREDGVQRRGLTRLRLADPVVRRDEPSPWAGR